MFYIYYQRLAVFKNIKDYVNGFRSNFGNDIGLYGASIGGFIIGIALIYKAFSN
jgi:hypothetical protein